MFASLQSLLPFQFGVSRFSPLVPSTLRQPIDNPRKLLYSNVSAVVIADANAVMVGIGLQEYKPT